MKKIVFLIVVCFAFTVFADGIIEIVPEPVSGVVNTDNIAVRGVYNSDVKKLRIRVEPKRDEEEYFPVILENINEVVDGLNGTYQGFYRQGIKLSPGSNKIILEELINGRWKQIKNVNVKYDPNNSDSKKTLWGRIANGEHRGEEQRAIYFYPGTRFPMKKAENDENNLSKTIVSPKFIEYLKDINKRDSSYSREVDWQNIAERLSRKDLTDTKGQGDNEQKCWSNEDTINKMMNEISDANANIVMFVYWGDHDATLKDDPELEIGASISEISDQNEAWNLADNFEKVNYAPTFPKTCNFNFKFSEKYCKHQYLEKIDATNSKKVKKLEKCQCTDPEFIDDPKEYMLCDPEQTCTGGMCYKACENNSDCKDSEICSESKCYKTCVNDNDCERPAICDTDVNSNKICRIQEETWFYHYYFDTDNCEEIYIHSEYENSGIDAQDRQFDAIDQLFKAASDRGLLVVPTLEPSVGDMQNFEINPRLLKQRLLKLLKKYGNNQNWLQVYDKSGNPRKVIHISQAVGAPRGNSELLNENSFKNTLDMIALQLKLELHSDSDIGFLLDITAMPPDRLLNGWYFPSATDLKEMDSFLGVSTFGLPFDQYLTVDYLNLIKWSDMENNNYFLPLEDHLFKKAKEWLVDWKNSEVPIIPDIIPGFDDRWRGESENSVFLIYGDNEKWRERFAKLMFMYNTAGFNLTIWNGYGEGYVWVPYRKRKFFNENNKYSIHPDYKEGNTAGNPPIPDDYANLNRLLDNSGNPEYEDDIINDNYCFANYLFGGPDGDKDGVPDACDNCPDVYNPMVINNEEIVAAPCETSKIGGAGCMPRTRTSTYRDNYGNWWWQPDHNLNGVGDACDREGYSEFIEFVEWSEFSGIPKGISVEENTVSQGSTHKIVSMRMNETLSVTIEMNSTNPAQDIETATTRYCWLPEWEHNLWGTDGYCTTEAGHTKGACEINFGYSHGSDPVPVNTEKVLNWKFIKDKIDSTKSNEFTGIEIKKNEVTKETKGSAIIDWDWRYDFKEDNPLDVGTILDTAPECHKLPASGFCDDGIVPKFYYTMSTGVHSGTDDPYLTENNEINPDFFKNKQKYARSSRLSLDPVIITYHREPVPYLAPIKYCFGAPCNFPMDWLHEMILENLINGPRPYENPGMEHYFKNEYGSDLINTGVAFREWKNNAAGNPAVSEKNRPIYLATIAKSAAGTNISLVSRSNMQTSAGGSFEIAEMDANSNGDWRTKGVLENVPDGFAPTASVHHNGTLYVVSSNGENGQVYEIRSTDQTTSPADGSNICFTAVPVYEPVLVDPLQSISNITIHSVGNDLVVLGKGGLGMEVYKLTDQGFENITGLNMPPVRDVYNTEVRDGILYLAGGMEFNKDLVDLKTDVWKFSEADGWQLIRNDINMFPVTLRIDFDGENIVLTNRVLKYNGTAERAVFNADGTGEITFGTVKVEGAPVRKFDQNYCINETGNSIFPGITNVYGECVKAENYNFDEITFPDYKLSVAGYRNSLYLGGLTGIRRLEIGENGEATKKEMIYSGESNNLAVYGNTLYAANYSEIDIFEIAGDGSISRKSSVKTNSCQNIRIENGKLFAAENKRVRIFDLNDPLSLEPVKTISLTNSVEDLEVTENRLFVYENQNKLLTRKGKVSVFDISNITTPQKIKEFSQYCNDPEMQKSGNRVYLGCKNGSFKITDSGLQKVNGEKNYLREGYVFDGILYQVFSGTLHKSEIDAAEVEEDGWI